ncbi:MAG: ribonuclease P protein subunit [Candidatus Thalassarchaeaceae archaeon]|jgi:RNase P/RNase MRP subunit p29|nr:hypothetical protein [Euryarchaeota archaeon]MDP6871170.1 ribonuclease P protein subunit [Candidatus Thalassarchaeaceae archaeon]
MSDIINQPWLAHEISVTGSSDPGLVGISGMITNETRRTIRIRTDSGELTIPKDVVTFTIDSSREIVGYKVTQRPEDRIGRRYK